MLTILVLLTIYISQPFKRTGTTYLEVDHSIENHVCTTISLFWIFFPLDDAVCPNAVCPDAVCPDALCPDAVCPDAVCPGVALKRSCRWQICGKNYTTEVYCSRRQGSSSINPVLPVTAFISSCNLFVKTREGVLSKRGHPLHESTPFHLTYRWI